MNPSGDAADNELHTYPYADFMGGFKMIRMPPLSILDSGGLQLKFQRLIRLTVSDIQAGKRLLERFRAICLARDVQSMAVFKLVDGGELNQIILLIGARNWEDYGKLEDLQEELAAIEAALKIKVLEGLRSETMIFREDLTLR